MADTKEDDVLLDIIDFVDISITPEEYNAVRAMYNSIYDKNIDATNIISHIILLMKIVSSFQTIDKIDKKKLVIFVVQKFIQLNISDKDELFILNSFAENILPNVIDTLCSIDSKKIIINAEQYVKTCCFPCFRRQ
jgi:hypothetical protein